MPALRRYRRSVSIGPTTFVRLREHARKQDTPIARLVDSVLRQYLDYHDEPHVDLGIVKQTIDQERDRNREERCERLRQAAREAFTF